MRTLSGGPAGGALAAPAGGAAALGCDADPAAVGPPALPAGAASAAGLLAGGLAGDAQAAASIASAATPASAVQTPRPCSRPIQLVALTVAPLPAAARRVPVPPLTVTGGWQRGH